MSGLKTKLESALGQPIEGVCPNRFHDHRQNHCAHFVSHMVGLDFSFNCVEFMGGEAEAANVRVHEVFAKCPLVGSFDDADRGRAQLVFVTRKTNVDLARKKMGNIPQKHIGVFCDGMIYHYSNSQDQVVKWTPEHFFETFQRIYSGDQGLYFGTIPGSDLVLNVEPSGEAVTRGLAFELTQDDTEWTARALSGPDQADFLVGREVNQPSKSYFGLYIPASRYYGPQYDPADHEPRIDHWAQLLDVTAHCESAGFMNLVNTYDRAKFTFGFYQLAAHTPDDNLILLFRELARLPAFSRYFPELTLKNGRLHRVDGDGGASNLEMLFDGKLQFFMNFLNPLRRPVDEQEVLHAARLMHWTANDPDCRAAQVNVSSEILQRKMVQRYHPWYGLHGRDDTICAIIADIHHQGRASKATVQEALTSQDKEKALLSVNDSSYGERNGRLAARVNRMKDSGALGRKIYDAAVNEFIDK